MPFHVVNGLPVHVKLAGPRSKHPKPCVARVEREGRDARCCGISSYLCDWPVEGGTCDAPLCAEHAIEVGRDRHYCPTHARLQREREPELF